jgi:hypothetical protein
MNMVPVFVDCDDGLESGKPLLSELLPEFKSLLVGNILVLMEGNYGVGAHTSIILMPEFLFVNHGLIDGIPGQGIGGRACHIDKAILYLLILQDIFDIVPQPSMIFCRLRYDLSDCHKASLSFL